MRSAAGFPGACFASPASKLLFVARALATTPSQPRKFYTMAKKKSGAGALVAAIHGGTGQRLRLGIDREDAVTDRQLTLNAQIHEAARAALAMVALKRKLASQ